MKHVFPVLFAACALMCLGFSEYWVALAAGVLAFAAWTSESILASDKIQHDQDDRAQLKRITKDPRACYLGICIYCHQKGFGPDSVGQWIVCTECLGDD